VGSKREKGREREEERHVGQRRGTGIIGVGRITWEEREKNPTHGIDYVRLARRLGRTFRRVNGEGGLGWGQVGVEKKKRIGQDRSYGTLTGAWRNRSSFQL